MQTLSITKKAALSFLQNLSLPGGKPTADQPTPPPHTTKTNHSDELPSPLPTTSTEISSFDPVLEDPPDPDLISIRIPGASTSGSNLTTTFNPNRKPLNSKKDRLASSFLSSISLDSVTEDNVTPSSPASAEVELVFGHDLEYPHRSTEGPSTRKRSEAYSLGTDVLSSSSDSSSDEELPYGKSVESFHDENLPPSASSRKSSYNHHIDQGHSPTNLNSSSRLSTKGLRTKRKVKSDKPASYSKRSTDSYAHLLYPKSTLRPDPPLEYNPYFLDDPKVQVETRSTGFSSLMDSLIQFAKSGENQADLDEFSKTHPSVDTSLNLSLIRSLKNKLLAMAQHLDLELASVAQAYAYFEKLCLQGLINKDNRKIKGACCLFLAIKVNEHKNKLVGFMEAADRYLDVTEKEILTTEFVTFSELEFNLFIPIQEFHSHMDRILIELEYVTLDAYVGHHPFYQQLPALPSP